MPSKRYGQGLRRHRPTDTAAHGFPLRAYALKDASQRSQSERTAGLAIDTFLADLAPPFASFIQDPGQPAEFWTDASIDGGFHDERLFGVASVCRMDAPLGTSLSTCSLTCLPQGRRTITASRVTDLE
jgi:hypothetical protein